MRAWAATHLPALLFTAAGLHLLAPAHAIAASTTQVIAVDWCVPPEGTEKCAFKAGPIPRVDADTNVVLHITHFNFVAYGLEYTVEETAIAAYQALDKLWAQLLGLPFLRREQPLAAAQRCADFGDCLRHWNARLIQVAEELELAIAGFKAKGPGIPQKDVDGLEATQTGFRSRREELETARKDTAAKLTSATLEEQEQYKSVRAAHNGVLEALDAFDQAADLTSKGQLKPLGKKKPGTHVAVTLTPKGVDAQPEQVEYFVHSSFPVLFHAGYVFSGLEATAFEKVRTVAGNDLFSQIKAEDASSDLTAFLSFELTSWGDGRNGVLLGLGTGVRSPGDTLFAVLSLRFKRRIFLSAGVGSNTVEEGSDAVASEVAEQLGLRELFAAITTRRQWKGFFGVSFSPF